MASSMLTGERRWASTRKSGMTVLGKVPKPINLPSQRLENHGLDPDVEIVPKGTLTWGSRPSPASPNAWGTPAYSSSNVDGGVGSPSRHNGRPSSGGSGTRPSTAGSDRSLETITNAWTSNSRPSSASGVLSSNQTSTLVARPRSAETRPGSSQLSRFAEPIPENSVLSRTASTADKLGHVSSKINDFSLSSGDFPTLGSEKNSDLQARPASRGSSGRPSSASSVGATQKERFEVSKSGHEVTDAQTEKGNTNTWKMDSGGGAPPDIDNWQRDHHMTQSYPNINLQQQHFNAWHGPPVGNPPDGIWYRGVPCGGPYRPTGPPGNYPVESFAYYPSQLPDRPMPNSQAAPRPEPVLGGYPHKNEDSFRPHMPSDSYVVRPAPIVPVRPGVFHGPMPYYGYYGPSRPNLDTSTGMTTGHGIFNQYQHQNAPNFHSQPNVHGQSAVSEQMEAGHAHETHGGQFRVLLKQHDGCVKNGIEEKREHSVSGDSSNLVTTVTPAAIKKSDAVKMAEQSSYVSANYSDNCSQVASLSSFSETSVKGEAIGHDQLKKCGLVGNDAEACQRITKKNHTLIEKIEGLNNKARIVDGRIDGPLSDKGERARRIKSENVRSDYSRESGQSHAVSFGKISTEKIPTTGAISGSHVPDVSMKGSNAESGKAKIMPQLSEVLHREHYHPQKDVRGLNDRLDVHVKSRFNGQDGDEWKKQVPGADRSSVSTITKVEKCSEVGSESCKSSEELTNNQALLHENNGDEACTSSSLDTMDYKAQRAKMKEIATQRAKQLQKEEEERTREQKAKALAKLEELNKRTLAENSNQKVDCIPSPNDACRAPKSDAMVDECLASAPKPDAVVDESLGSSSASTCGEAIIQTSGRDTRKIGTMDVVQTSSITIHSNRGMILVQGSDPAGSKPEVSTLTQRIDSGNSKPGGSNALSSCDYVMDKPGSPAVVEKNDSVIGKLGGTHEASRSNYLVTSNSPLSSDPSAPTSQKTNVQVPVSTFSKQKQPGHKRRQTIKQEKNSGERPGSPVNNSSTEVPQERADMHLLVTDGMVNNSNESDLTLPHKKRGNRSIRSKNRQDEAPLIPTLPSVSSSEGIIKDPLESGKLKSLESVLDHPSKEFTTRQSSGDTFVSLNQSWYQGSEEGQAKAVNQWKPHHPRKATRNLQARPEDKIHGTEAVWTPVKPLSKSEPAEVVARDITSEVGDHALAKNGNNLQGNLKWKRAEMERYVPKVVAKELCQQGNSQQSSGHHQVRPLEVISGSNAASSQSTNEGWGSAVTPAEILSGSKNPDHGRPGKHGKSHTSWRQRGLHEGSSADATETSKNHSDNNQSAKHGTPIAEATHSGGEKNLVNVNSLLNDEPLAISSVEKGATNKGKRQPYKFQKVVGTNTVSGATKNLPSETIVKLDAHSTPGTNDLEFKTTSTIANKNVGENTRSHWKPKSQVYSSRNHQGDAGYMEGQRVATRSGTVDKEHLEFIGDHQLWNVEDKNNVTWGTETLEAANVHHHESGKERKGVARLVKDQTGLPNQEFSNIAGEDLAEIGPHPRHAISSGMHQHEHHNAGFGRGQETSRAGGRGFGQDIGKHQLAAKSGRSRQGSNYGYQRVEHQNKHNDSFQAGEGSKDGFNAAAPNYRGGGRNLSKRGGHFYACNNGPSPRAGVTYGDGE